MRIANRTVRNLNARAEEMERDAASYPEVGGFASAASVLRSSAALLEAKAARREADQVSANPSEEKAAHYAEGAGKARKEADDWKAMADRMAGSKDPLGRKARQNALEAAVAFGEAADYFTVAETLASSRAKAGAEAESPSPFPP